MMLNHANLFASDVPAPSGLFTGHLGFEEQAGDGVAILRASLPARREKEAERLSCRPRSRSIVLWSLIRPAV